MALGVDMRFSGKHNYFLQINFFHRCNKSFIFYYFHYFYLTTTYQIMIKNHGLLIIKSILSNISRGIL